MPNGEYFPAFDFRGLSTVEELEWATGGMDITGGKHVEINIFSRERLEERKVLPNQPASGSFAAKKGDRCSIFNAHYAGTRRTFEGSVDAIHFV